MMEMVPAADDQSNWVGWIAKGGASGYFGAANTLAIGVCVGETRMQIILLSTGVDTGSSLVVNQRSR